MPPVSPRLRRRRMTPVWRVISMGTASTESILDDPAQN
jgi:hypothetical protein